MLKNDISAQKKLAKMQEEIIEEVQNALLEMGALEALPPIPDSINSQLSHEVLSKNSNQGIPRLKTFSICL